MCCVWMLVWTGGECVTMPIELVYSALYFQHEIEAKLQHQNFARKQSVSTNTLHIVKLSLS